MPLFLNPYFRKFVNIGPDEEKFGRRYLHSNVREQTKQTPPAVYM